MSLDSREKGDGELPVKESADGKTGWLDGFVRRIRSRFSKFISRETKKDATLVEKQAAPQLSKEQQRAEAIRQVLRNHTDVITSPLPQRADKYYAEIVERLNNLIQDLSFARRAPALYFQREKDERQSDFERRLRNNVRSLAGSILAEEEFLPLVHALGLNSNALIKKRGGPEPAGEKRFYPKARKK